MKRLAAALLVVALALVFLRWFLPVDRNAPNFSQHPGFAEYFARNPPSDAPPSTAGQDLLRKHRPRFFVGEGEEGPIGFYDDYIAHGTLEGSAVIAAVTRAALNAHKDDPRAVFSHRAAVKPPEPAIFGRIDRTADFTVLTYHAVFRKSGLPAGMSWWQWAGLNLVGDTRDWHQLDHYTAVFLYLDRDLVPVAMMLQQHHYQCSYLFGESVELPADGRPLVDIAIASNELYPHAEGRLRRRAVSMITPSALRYMLGAAARPMTTADDITDPSREVDYRLDFLPPSDAFYTFKGYLGARRLLPGRDGPPGAQYNTLPEFKPLEVQLAMGYWRPGNAGDLARLPKNQDWNEYLAFAAAQGEILRANIACLRRGKIGCELQ
ncbi:MAG: hypothetical protein ACT4SY_01500 [Hyphomicrobiales bacterium]